MSARPSSPGGQLPVIGQEVDFYGHTAGIHSALAALPRRQMYIVNIQLCHIIILGLLEIIRATNTEKPIEPIEPGIFGAAGLELVQGVCPVFVTRVSLQHFYSIKNYVLVEIGHALHIEVPKFAHVLVVVEFLHHLLGDLENLVARHQQAA